MGRRHQCFAIARVVPYGYPDSQPKFRCVAAYHNQYCQDAQPLEAIRRFVTLLQQTENAEVVQAEVKNIQRKYGRRLREPAIPRYPCPFTLSILGIAYSIKGTPSDEDEGSSLGINTVSSNILEADIGAWDCGKSLR